MPKTAFFISERYLKDNSPIQNNFDVKDIYPYARTAEDKYVQETIGTALYEHLQTEIDASPMGLTADEITLVKIIRDALVWLTPYEALPFLWVKLRNIGPVKQGGENLETVSLDELEKVRVSLLANGTFYLNRLKDYLCENSNLFEDYRAGCWNCGDLSANNSRTNSTDMFFDRNKVEDYDKKFYIKYIR